MSMSSDVILEPVSSARKTLSCSSPTSSSSNAQLRKIKKPLIERRRRERINECLGQLKALVLEATNKDESRYSKMEKADILEMTVAHLKFVHNAKSLHADAGPGSRHVLTGDVELHPATMSVANDTSSGSAAIRYLMGYNECVREVSNYLAADDHTTSRVGDDVRAALMRHLDESLRLRATAPIVQALRLPSAGTPGSIGLFLQVGAQDPDATSSRAHRLNMESLSPGSVELAVDSASAAPCRNRCDSGVYSGASSPAQADELVAAAGFAASVQFPLELTSGSRDTNATITTNICSDFSQSKQHIHVRTVEDSTSTEVWRPW